MTNWKDPKKEKPPQGLKVLCMDRGDFYVAQRFGDYWFPIPFTDSKYSRYFVPELWQEIDFPNGYSGKLRVIKGGTLMDINQIEIKHPEVYYEILNFLLKISENGMKDKRDFEENI